MTDPVAALIEESITIDAAPERVWSLVSDLGRMSKWSPQVVKTVVRGRPIKLGTKMVNINRRGPLVWPTQTKVVRFEPQQEIAFRVKDNFTIWSFTLTSDSAGGTILTQRREAPDGISTDLAHPHRQGARWRGELPGRARGGHARDAGEDQGRRGALTLRRTDMTTALPPEGDRAEGVSERLTRQQ